MFGFEPCTQRFGKYDKFAGFHFDMRYVLFIGIPLFVYS